MRASLCLLACALLGCEEPRWEVVHRDLDEGLINVWGRSSTDVYAVGSDTGNGPIVIHYDGEAWTRLETGVRGDIWWINGREEGSIFLAGARGMILRYDGTTFTEMETPETTATVFGVWMAAEDDVWAVGGSGDRAGFAWHYDGTAWTELDVPDLQGRGLLKVWGNASDDVWLVGAADEAAGLDAATYHWDGSALTPVESGVGGTLFTVHMQGERVAACGGSGTAAIVELEDGEWVDHSPPFVPALFGVWLAEDQGWAVGAYGTIVRETDNGWVQEDTEFAFVPAFHSVWVDDTGGAWSIGGQILVAPITDGVLVHRGSHVDDTFVE
jgi:hypothetical protein